MSGNPCESLSLADSVAGIYFRCESPAYIAGVTNPIFQSSRAWDLLLVIGAGTVTVAKDIHTTYPVTSNPGIGAPLISRTGTLKAESSISSEDDIGRLMTKDGAKSDFVVKSDNNADKVFIDDVGVSQLPSGVEANNVFPQIRAAIEDHFGESLVRMRFTEYVTRFVRLASRYEEEVNGSTKFGFQSSIFTEAPGRMAQLGSGIAFVDDATYIRELSANAQRIEAWRKTNSYRYCVLVRPFPLFCFSIITHTNQDWAKFQANSAVKGFDVLHQLFRLRHAKNMLDLEATIIMRTLADNVKSYEQVVEVCDLRSVLAYFFDGKFTSATGTSDATRWRAHAPGIRALPPKRSSARSHGGPF